MQEMKPIKEGKVREIYDNGDSLIMVATDRISCFDVILNNQVTKKGTVLTQMSKFWFDMTEDILPNHMISVDVKDMPEFFQQEKFDGNSMMCRKLEMLPIECIVRGYITGSGWESYKKTGKVCGIELPEGLKESDKLPEPIYTPSTKAEIGDHDENISYEQSIAHLEKYFPGRGEELAAKLRDNTIALYKKCAEYALSKGIIIADTKFEFGLDENGNVVDSFMPFNTVEWEKEQEAKEEANQSDSNSEEESKDSSTSQQHKQNNNRSNNTGNSVHRVLGKTTQQPATEAGTDEVTEAEQTTVKSSAKRGLLCGTLLAAVIIIIIFVVMHKKNNKKGNEHDTKK